MYHLYYVTFSQQSVASTDDTRISGVNDCPKNCLCSRNIEADYKVCTSTQVCVYEGERGN